jgi:hypothetical protein
VILKRVGLGLVCSLLLFAVKAQAAAPGTSPLGGALKTVDLASDTAWTLRVDGKDPARSIRVPGGGWTSDQQSPQLCDVDDVKDHVVYERKITVPKVTPGQVTKIIFGALHVSGEVYIDNQLVATHAGVNTPFEVDISAVVEPGKTHVLKVKAHSRFHYGPTPNIPVAHDQISQKYAEGRPHYRYMHAYGIVKFIKLVVYPPVFIRDYFIQPSVEKDQLEVHVWVANRSDRPRSLTLEWGLRPWNSDKTWSYPTLPEVTAEIPPGEVKKLVLAPVRWGLGRDSYWWPNIPFREDYTAVLHHLDLRLLEGKTLLNELTKRFGFCEHREGPFYYTVNGVRVNGISDSPWEGCTMSCYDAYSAAPAFLPPTGPKTGCPETWRRYMRIGFNTVRVQLTVPTEYMMEAADEVGLMLMPETPISNDFQVWHDEHMPNSTRETVRWCRNNPCIARYSLGNEIWKIHLGKPWHRLIDVAREEDPTRPLVFDGGKVKGERIWTRVEGEKSGHAYKTWHYYPRPIQPPEGLTKEKPLIVMTGEFAWKPDGMHDLALDGRRMRRYDYAYFCTWTWLNYWPNFLEGMSYEKHGFLFSRGAERKDNVNGWHSPIVRFVQKSLDPYLLQDLELEKANPLEIYQQRKVGQGSITWPKVVPTYPPKSPVARRIEVFNGGLFGSKMSLQWETRWDKPDGPLVGSGQSDPFEIQPGFHATREISFTSPPTDRKRALYLVMKSLMHGKVVFEEDQIYFWIVPE